MPEDEILLSGGSVLHQIDPRVKVCGLGLLSLLLTFSHPPGLLLSSFWLILLLVIGRTPLKLFRGIGLAMVWLGIFYCLATGWVWPAHGPFWHGHWSEPGLLQALLILWRILLIFVLTRLFAAVTLPVEQGLGIAYFFTPLAKRSAKAAEFALLLTLTLRFIPLIQEEAALIWKARLLKGKWPVSWFGRTREIMQLFVPLILLCLRRAEELGETMLARGYGSSSPKMFFLHKKSSLNFRSGIIIGVWGGLLLFWH